MSDVSEHLEKRVSLGEELHARREEFGMSADALARVISVSPKHIRALEDGDYAVFGAKVYARGVLKKMLAVMAVGEDEYFMRLLDEAWGVREKETGGRRGFSPLAREKMYLTPARAGIGAVAVVLAAFVFFAASRLTRFNGRPLLIVDLPQDRAALREQMVRVEGRTERESKLTVNGREITINEQGDFGERIELQPGATALIFISENRFGKMSQVTRHVIVE